MNTCTANRKAGRHILQCSWYSTSKLQYTLWWNWEDHNIVLINISLRCASPKILNYFFLADYMDENCGKTLNLDTFFRLQASRNNNLQSSLNCSVDIFATSKKLGGSARVLARFLSINMPFSTPVSGCDRVKLELHDGIRNKTLLTRECNYKL